MSQAELLTVSPAATASFPGHHHSGGFNHSFLLVLHFSLKLPSPESILQPPTAVICLNAADEPDLPGFPEVTSLILHILAPEVSVPCFPLVLD